MLRKKENCYFNSSLDDIGFNNCKKRSLKVKHKNMLFLFLMSVFWLLIRSGTKPSRITYPCQKTSVENIIQSFNISIHSFLSYLWSGVTIFFVEKRNFLIVLGIIVSSFFISVNIPLNNPLIQNSIFRENNQEIQLSLKPHNATNLPASDIFIVNGLSNANVSNLVQLMGEKNLLLYKSSQQGSIMGPNGLIANNDVIIIKINCQWACRGGTNTDILKELIQLIVDHPDSFSGEIVVADNGQGRGYFDFYNNNNAEDKSQSTQDVVDSFSSLYNVSIYSWQDIMSIEVNEFSYGDLDDGYILNHTADLETGLYVTYPKFTTKYGTHVSFKHGIWNGTMYEKRLKVINLPVLKTHSGFSVTGAVKNYMGVQSEKEFNNQGGLGNGHYTIAKGSMGTLMAEVGLPTLNIIDAIHVNAKPRGGPATLYEQATRTNILMSSVDPIALDFWAAKYILLETAKKLGYTDISSINPHTVASSSFGCWLNKSKDELLASGYQVTTNENQMNVYVNQVLNSNRNSVSSYFSDGISLIFIFLVSFILLVQIKRRNKNR